jgi:hypothetical protein
MRDQEVVNAALRDATRILSEYLEPGAPRNDRQTIQKLLEVLDNQTLAAALDRLSKGYGVKVVK